MTARIVWNNVSRMTHFAVREQKTKCMRIVVSHCLNPVDLAVLDDFLPVKGQLHIAVNRSSTPSVCGQPFAIDSTYSRRIPNEPVDAHLRICAELPADERHGTRSKTSTLQLMKRVRLREF